MMRSLKLAATTGIGLSLASFAPGDDLPVALMAVLAPGQADHKTCDTPRDGTVMIQRLLISPAAAAPVNEERAVRWHRAGLSPG
ncbi:hypothetical protein WBP07_07965 [Novosphingobium sp. BL-8A]|uniref:hypothetical protein n=1 Tax=Novosphingobium sp. BL-8A TaxID=3127639 RepID=UPI0037582122